MFYIVIEKKFLLNIFIKNRKVRVGNLGFLTPHSSHLTSHFS